MIRWLALPPDVVLFSTSLVASFTVPAFLAIRGELHVGGIGRYWWLFSLLALASITNNLSYFYALGHTTVSNAVFTHYTAPIFVALLAPIVISERLQKITMLSLPIAVLGMVMIVSAGGGLVLQGEHTAGIVAGTISGLAYAFIIIFSRKLSRMLMHHKAVVLLPWITTVVMAPAVFLTEYHLDGRKMSAPVADWSVSFDACPAALLRCTQKSHGPARSDPRIHGTSCRNTPGIRASVGNTFSLCTLRRCLDSFFRLPCCSLASWSGILSTLVGKGNILICLIMTLREDFRI